MAKDPPILSTLPTAVSLAKVFIGHVQLRDLIICPHEHGIVNYVSGKSIVEHNVRNPASPRILAETTFVPNTLASLPIEGTDSSILAAGGQDAQIYLSVQQCNRAPSRKFETFLPGSINNSVLLTSLSLARSNQSSAEPRIGISNNDCTFRLYDVLIRTREPTTGNRSIKEVGSVKLDVPVNHSSVSPDGRTLLSAGDSNKVYLHHLSGGSRITFTPISTLGLPVCSTENMSYYSSLTASFSTAFSGNGSKFAVASQEGTVVVWDVRSSKPLKVLYTNRERKCSSSYNEMNDASGWLSDDPWDWTRGTSKAPGWSVRSLKFGCDRYGGKEVMAFTEHTSLMHVVDARTFETEEIVRMPSIPRSNTVTEHVDTEAHQYTSSAQAAPARSHHPRSRYRPFHMLPGNNGPRLPRPTQPQRFVLALEDTFRLSPQQHHSYSRDADMPEEDDEESAQHHTDDDILVIPPLGDRAVEADVRALLGRHGIRARHHRPHEMSADTTNGDQQRQRQASSNAMDVDELESDYCASHTPSRSSSPSPSANLPYQGSSPNVRYSHLSRSPSHLSLSPSRQYTAYHRNAHLTSPMAVDPSRDLFEEPIGISDPFEDDEKHEPDLAGVCFDPTGRWVYVASTEGVAEWKVNGTEKRWWFDMDEGWA